MPNDKIRLYLSGGSNRSALGSIGTLMFLIMNQPQGEYHWRDVDEVIGVSGGSQPIAAIMAGLNRSSPSVSVRDPQGRLLADDDDRHTVESLAGFYRTIVSDGEHWKASRRRRIVFALVSLACLPVVIFATAFFVPGFLAYPLGLVSIPIVYRVGSWLMSRYLRDMLHAFMHGAHTAGADATMAELTAAAQARGPQRGYFIGTAGLATGNNYFFWAGQGYRDFPSGVSRSASSPIDAILASCSLPPLSQPGRPPAAHVLRHVGTNEVWETRPAVVPEKEALLDGGYGGNFGVQITQRVLQEIAVRPNWPVSPSSSSAAAPRRILAVDAGRRLETGGAAIGAARALSTVLRLMRVIQVSVDATYTNDIQDLEDVDGSVIAVSRTDDPAATAGYGAAARAIEKRLCRAVQLNAQLGLTNLDQCRAEIAVIVGVVGTYLAEVQRRLEQGNPLPASHLELNGVLRSIGDAFGAVPTANLVSRWNSVDGLYLKAVSEGVIEDVC